MGKTGNEKSCLISYGIAILLTVAVFGVFFMGTEGIAQINNMACQQYQCDGIGTMEGEVIAAEPTCVELCQDDFYSVLYGGWFDCYLYPATDPRHRLGTAYTYMGWAGCSMERKGVSIIANVSYIQDGFGYVELFKCTPCNNCCSD
jgi:hypothetical protein